MTPVLPGSDGSFQTPFAPLKLTSLNMGYWVLHLLIHLLSIEQGCVSIGCYYSVCSLALLLMAILKPNLFFLFVGQTDSHEKKSVVGMCSFFSEGR